MPTSILAIAIGDPANSRTIKKATQINGARPYIMGLYNYLSQKTTYSLGKDYSIEYQECFEGKETFTGTHQIIFGMSTPVVRKAKDFTSHMTTPTPVVGIFSEHATENFDTTPNICGVNGKRIKHALDYYKCFVATVPLTKVYILHRENNTAADKCWNAIRTSGALTVPISQLTLTTTPGTDPTADIVALIDTVPSGPKSGLLVLPVDVFFGAAPDIFQEARKQQLSVFWPSSDWCPPAVCAHGASQEACGELMGEQVKYILDNLGGSQPIPTGAARFVDFPDAEIECVAGAAAAKALDIELREHHGLQVI